jgi:hypothetical protein
LDLLALRNCKIETLQKRTETEVEKLKTKKEKRRTGHERGGNEEAREVVGGWCVCCV